MMEDMAKSVKGLKISDAGNAAMETALILPLLFSLVFSLLDASRLFIIHSVLQTSSSMVALQFEVGEIEEGELKSGVFRASEEIASGWISKASLTVSHQLSEGEPPSGAYLEIDYDGHDGIASPLSFFADSLYRIRIHHSVQRNGM
ncbi:MAG: pilus assembly protein [Sneathiellales bacterium]|nr:pilus assembly protein [Sneathiellales bacterium]